MSQRSEKVSAATIRKEAGVLKHLLRYSVDHGYIPSNAARNVRLPKPPAGRLRYLQPKELRGILERLSPEVRAVAQVAVATGMRRGEILGLRWVDVDLLNRA